MDKSKNYQAEGKKTKREQVYMILFTKKILENAN